MKLIIIQEVLSRVFVKVMSAFGGWRPIFGRTFGVELGNDITTLLTEGFVKMITAARSKVFTLAGNPFNKLNIQCSLSKNGMTSQCLMVCVGYIELYNPMSHLYNEFFLGT